MGCGRPGCEIAEDRDTLIITRVRVTLSEHYFCAGLVHLWTENKLTGLAAGEPPTVTIAADRPTRNHLGESGYVCLGVSAPNTQRMQLEYFTCEVFVYPDASLVRLSPRQQAGRP